MNILSLARCEAAASTSPHGQEGVRLGVGSTFRSSYPTSCPEFLALPETRACAAPSRGDGGACS